MKAKRWVASALAGIFIFLSFPKFSLEPLIWISLAFLFYAVEDTPPKQAFFFGFITGVTAYFGLLYWLAGTMHRYGNLPYLLSIGVLILLVSYLSLYFGAFACLKRCMERRGLNSILLAPILWVALEYLRSFVLSGFPWASLGYSQYLNLPLIQIAEFTGIYGISFLIVLLNMLIFNIFKNRLKRKEGILVIFFLLCVLVYGLVRMEELEQEIGADARIRVGILQGNIAQSVKWDKRYKDEIFDIYKKLTINAINARARLIIWPEASLPGYFQSSREYVSVIRELAKNAKIFILFGAPFYETNGNSIKNYNSAFLVGPDGRIIGRYDKIHLVPFGEYVPFSKVLTFVNKMVEGIGDFSPGEGIRILRAGDIPFGVLICFEEIFPDLVRRFVKKGALFLINITNDAWFGRTSAPYQLLSMVVFRAVENRVWIARSANTGISSIIDPLGRIVYNTDIFKREYFVRDIGIRDKKTFYTKYGDLFARINLLITIFLLGFSLFNKRRGYEREDK